MDKRHNGFARMLYWSPRMLAFLLAGFLVALSLDVFEDGFGFWPTLAALFVHLIPAFVVSIALWISWRFEWFGTVAFSGLGIAYFAAFEGWRHLPASLLLTLVPLLIALLFLLHRRAIRP